jgi:ZIP family zinc transporter
MTAIGASIVFFFKNISKNIMDAMLGFAAGVMTAASFFSLLSPAIEHCESLNITPWIITSIGFLCGGLLLFISDKIFNKILSRKNKRILMLISSITIHNIPEGLAVGIAFGSVYYGLTGATTISALLLALGIGLQNFPEGSAVSIPLLRDGMSKKKAFFYGQLSAIVEPIFGVIGAILVLKVRILLPFFLSFAAGAMIYVVVSELIPESQSNKKKEVMAIFTIIGFTIMMLLDVALG